MLLLDAILDANHRAVAGDASAGLRPADYAEELPIIALTCIDPRLNAYLPNVLGVPPEDFIWLRNAGNIVTGPLSSTMRSLALACALRGGHEIVVIGHTDCLVCHTPTMVLLDRLKALGVDRARLPENLNEFFGGFGSERQNVIKACDFIRHSPLIGPRIPVHGLLLDLENGNLDWVVNGYETLAAAGAPATGSAGAAAPGQPFAPLGSFESFAAGEMKFPEAKIGDMAAHVDSAVSQAAAEIGAKVEPAVEAAAQSAGSMAEKMVEFAEKNWPKPPGVRMQPSPLPPKKTLPPPIRPRANLRRGGRV